MQISKPFGVGQITHIKPEEPMLLSEVFKKALFENFEFLLNLGAIYVDDKRASKDLTVSQDSLVRIHKNPKRHPVQDISWKDLIIENNEHFVVINKPYLVPTHATVDNFRENVIYQLSQFLGCELFITHRLDVETTGLLLFAKSKQFQTIYNYLIVNKKITKKYRVLTCRKPEEGQQVHYINSDKFVPKLVSREPIEGWPYCELIIEKVSSITLPDGTLGYESIVRLITGRTHQIRAQFTGMNCVLFGDTLYGDENKDYPLGLQSFYLEFSWPAIKKNYHFEL